MVVVEMADLDVCSCRISAVKLSLSNKFCQLRLNPCVVLEVYNKYRNKTYTIVAELHVISLTA